MPDGSEKPVTFASRRLSQTERNYSQIEKETLAIIYAIKKFHQYLFGERFILFTDHKPLLGLFSEKKGINNIAAARMQRWAILLFAYDYTLKYCSGAENSNADFFSHFPSNEKPTTSTIKNKIFMSELSYSPVTSKEVADFSKKDPANVTDYVLSGWPNKVQEQFKPYLYRKNELSVESDCLIWRNRVIIPFRLRNKILTELHENHPGIVRMKALACSYVWWAGIDIEIENTVKSCNACQINHIMSAKAPAHPWEKTTSPWVRLHIDFAGPFLDKMFFIIYD